MGTPTMIPHVINYFYFDFATSHITLLHTVVENTGRNKSIGVYMKQK